MDNQVPVLHVSESVSITRHFQSTNQSNPCRDYINLADRWRSVTEWRILGEMNADNSGKPVLQLFNCPHTDCGATFSRRWKLEEHDTVHTGARPYQCTVEACGRRFSRRSHLKQHVKLHTGVKHFKCKFSSCTKSFFNSGKLKRHVRYSHGEKNDFFKCDQTNCSLTFRKRRQFKLHLLKHGVSAEFKCGKDGCAATFDSHVSRKAHEKKHRGYRCPHGDCQTRETTWGKLQRHVAKHPVSFQCQACKKPFKTREALRRHKRVHAIHKPVLVCPREECQAYFSTTFNLQHHIRKVHLELLKYKCAFADCPRTFAMRESLARHLLRHDPAAAAVKKRRRPKKTWQKRLNGQQRPITEDNLHRLFSLRMRLFRRAKVETNLAGLFNERKIPHYVDPEVNLRGLFSIKPPRQGDAPDVAP